MNLPILLGITGGIGSGKSTICNILEVLGYPVYYADDRAKWLMNHDQNLKKEISYLFGEESYTDSGLNRAYIAQVAFQDQALLSKLNQLVHPSVARDFESWTELQHTPLVAKEAALLFETGSYRDLTANWLVTCPEELRISRITKRDAHRTKEDVRSIMEKQWSDKKKRTLADVEIINDGKTPVLEKVLVQIKKLTA
jgi:dephospho-CoA kinase